MRLFALLPLLALLALPSCASIIDGGPDQVPVNSDPDGATVLLDGAAVGKTPCTVSVPRHVGGHNMLLELDGYHPQPVALASSVNGWLFGNLVFGGLIGIAIDFGTGNAVRTSTVPIQVVMIPLDEPDPTASIQSAKPKPKPKPEERYAPARFGGPPPSGEGTP